MTTIHQAIFAVNGSYGHSSTASSLQDQNFLNRLAPKTDIPSQLPAGVNLETYYSSFRLDDKWVLAKTFPDHEASRGQSVFTHAFFFEMPPQFIHALFFEFPSPGTENLGLLPSLSELSEFFPKKIHRTEVLEPFEFSESQAERTASSGLSNAMVHKLLSSSREEKPLICLGSPTAFFKAYCEIWDLLPFEMRLNFELRVAYSPNSIHTDNSIFVSPKMLASKWEGHPKISDTDVYVPSKESEYWVLGMPENASALIRFMEELQLVPGSFGHLQRVQAIFEMLSRKDSQSQIASFREVASVCPNPDVGKEIKAKLIDSICSFLESATTGDWMKMRNMPLEALLEAASKIGKAFQKWVQQGFPNLSIEDAEQVAGTLSKNNLKPWWRENLSSGLKQSFRQIKNTRQIWDLLNTGRSMVDILSPLFPLSKDFEKRLLQGKLKENNPVVLQSLVSTVKANNWLPLHASLVGELMPPDEAVVAQLKLDNDPTHHDGLLELSKWIAPKEWFVQTHHFEEDRMVKIAAQQSMEDGSLFHGFDVSIPVWRSIWLERIRTAKDWLWKDIGSPAEVCISIMNLLLAGSVLDQELLVPITESYHFNPVDHEHRAQLWTLLPVQSQDVVLDRTALSIIKQIFHDDHISGTLEKPLQIAVGDALELNSSGLSSLQNPELVVQLFEVLPLKEKSLGKILRNGKVQFNSAQSIRIGRILLKQGWLDIARFLKRNRKTRSDFCIAYELCEDLAPRSALETLSDLFRSIPEYRNHPNQSKKMKILFASANPYGENPIRADFELSKVEEWIKKSKNRDQMDLHSLNATVLKDFVQELIEFNPSMVQFSGHGNSSGLLFETRDGTGHLVNAKVLKGLFGRLKNTLQCIVLNACYSKEQAIEISKFGIYVVGMSDDIKDVASREFSESFYIAVSGGMGWKDAFFMAISGMFAHCGEEQAAIPELWYKGERIHEND